jgi:hypothetical protein
MGALKSKAPFAEFINDLNSGYLKMLKTIKEPESFAEQFPCSLCDARGYLMMKVQFSKLNTPSVLFEKRNGETIVAHSMCPCPACGGTGIDSVAFMSAPVAVGD